jgi:hypothetical protein
MKRVSIQSLLSLVSHLERFRVPDVFALVSAYRQFCQLQIANRNIAIGLKKELNTILHASLQRVRVADCEPGSGSRYNRTAAETPREVKSSHWYTLEVLAGFPDKYREIVTEKSELVNQDLILLSSIGERLAKLRSRCLEVWKPVNAIQAELLSVLSASIPHWRWSTYRAEKHHTDNVHGHAIELLAKYSPVLPSRKLRYKRGKLEGRVSVVRGTGTLNRVRHADYAPEKTPAVRWQDMFADCRKRDGMLWRLANQLFRHSAIAQGVALCGKSISRAAHYLVSNAADYDRLPPYACTTRSEYCKAVVAEYVSKSRHLKLAPNQPVCSPGVVHQIVLTDWEPVSFVGIVPEPDKASGMGLVSRRVLCHDFRTGFTLYREYALDSTGQDRETLDILRRVETYHEVCKPLVMPNYARIVETLGFRFRDRKSSMEYRSYDGLTERERSRKKTASVLVRLRRIPEVSLQDSYSAGNCKPGTSQFCRSIGVDTEKVSGRELAKRWQAAGYPMQQIGLFLATIAMAEERSGDNKEEVVSC